MSVEDAEAGFGNCVNDVDQAELTTCDDERVKGEGVICPGDVEELVLRSQPRNLTSRASLTFGMVSSQSSSHGSSSRHLPSLS